MENNINAKSPAEQHAVFKKAIDQMIATNDRAYNSRWNKQGLQHKTNYSKAEIEKIIENGSLTEKQTLSRFFFNKDGVYKRLIVHYATLLKYAGLLIPNPAPGKNLSQENISKRYYNALDFVEKIDLVGFFANCAIKAYRDGCYYGVITKLDKTAFSVLDLPVAYCVSNFKDQFGNDIIEFNLGYFNTISSEQDREAALNTYPKVISSAYRKYSKGKRGAWLMIPSDIGICFPTFNGLPTFLSVILSTAEYKEAVQREVEKQREEIKKIIVQKIPHNNTTNELLFEPDEAEEIHLGTVGMMKGEENIRVLTTYADVDSIVSKTSSDALSNVLENMINQIYLEAGTSNQFFSAIGSATTDGSITNDLAFVMILANKFASFVTNMINYLYANGNISFKYKILPVTWHNQSEYITNSFKLAGSGYSWLLPAIAMDMSQKDIINVKDLENDLLKLKDKFIPLSSIYTASSEKQSGDNSSKENKEINEEGKPGRPEKPVEQKEEATQKKDRSLDKTGGSR